MNELILKDESFKIVGCCFNVHKEPGKGFSEIVYKDALQYEFYLNNIDYEREKEFAIKYKDTILSHHYCADFIVFNKIILEVKAIESLGNSHIKQTLNYLAATHLNLGLLVNFGEDSLKYKRIIL